MVYLLSQSHDEDDFVIYQQNPTKQILIHDMATSSSVLTYIKMNKKSGSLRNVTNAEFMSDGRLPLVLSTNDNNLMCGFTEVFWHLARENNCRPSLAELAYIDWVETNFLEAELYLCWCYEPVVNEYTWNRYTYDLPWPVSTILFNRKRRQMEKSVGRKFKNFDDFINKFNRFLDLLNRRIASRDQLFPSVEALIYGHTNAIEISNIHPMLNLNKHRRIMSLRDHVGQLYPS